jgi:hypothetical protein
VFVSEAPALDRVRLQHFDLRGGYGKPAEQVNTDEVRREVASDLHHFARVAN